MKRVFSAIELPDSVKRSVESYSGALARDFPDSGAKWSRTDSLHLTVRFFGNVDEGALEVITDAHKGASAGYPAFRLAIKGTGVFPAPGRPKVLWLGITGAEPLVEFKEEVDSRLAAEGIAPENRKFSPHLTVARLKDPFKARALARRHLSQEFEPVGFNVSRIVIFESVLKPTGPEYSMIDCAEFRT